MRTLNLNRIEIFLAVQQHGSLRAAATALHIRPPAVSQQLSALEQDLGMKLFIRTTRSLTLTEQGKVFLDQIRPAFAQINSAIESSRDITSSSKGNLRITLPYRAYQLVIQPKLAEFHTLFPGVQLELSFNESFVDIIEQDFHAGIRLGEHVSENMVAVRLTAPIKEAYVASPGYFDSNGTPQVPKDLFQHQCITYRQIESGRIMPWRFSSEQDTYELNPGGYLIFDNLRAVVDAAKSGLGIGWSLKDGVSRELEKGELVSVLEGFSIQRPGFFLYYPYSHRQYNVLRIFSDFFKYQ